MTPNEPAKNQTSRCRRSSDNQRKQNPRWLPSKSFVFYQIVFFCYGEWYLSAILSLLAFSRNFVEFMLKIGVLVSNLVCFAISLDAILPE
jgi:hypothetical protein